MSRAGITKELTDAITDLELAQSNGARPDDVDKLRRRIARLAGSMESDQTHTWDLEIIRMDEVKERDVPWLWQPYLVRGELHSLQAPPGMGKSSAALAIGAAITTGGLLPDEDGEHYRRVEPGNVLWFSHEDHPEFVLRRRLRQQEADAARFFLVAGKQADDPDTGTVRAPATLQDLAELRRAFETYQPALVVFDPLQQWLGGNVDMNAANETRPVLDGLAELCREFDCAAILIRHVSKAGQRTALDMGMGSGDVSGACRIVLALGSEADDPEAPRGLLCLKSNVGPEPRALAYRIMRGEGVPEDDRGKFEWTGPSHLTRGDLQSPKKRRGEVNPDDRLAEDAETLRDLLRAGPMLAATLESAAKDGHGLNHPRYWAARDTIGVRHRQRKNPDTGKREVWVWLPSAPPAWLAESA